MSVNNAYTWSFSYDALNRLRAADYDSSASSQFDLMGLSYDPSGNITALQRHDEAGSLIDDLGYTYQTGTNRLGSLSDAIAAITPNWDAEDAGFGYVNNGNLTSQSGKIDNIAYEPRNLPVRFALAGGDTLLAAYNAAGWRILKESSGGAWQFYVADGQQTLAVITKSSEGQTSMHFNLTGNGLFDRWEPGGVRRYYVTDHLGSTRAVVDDVGTVLETFDYYPFGLLMPKSNTAGANTIEKFTGKERDEEGGLNLDYFGARYYDPALGRWHSVDPLAEKHPEWTPYNYVLNNPMYYIDPDGRQIAGIRATADRLLPPYCSTPPMLRSDPTAVCI